MYKIVFTLISMLLLNACSGDKNPQISTSAPPEEPQLVLEAKSGVVSGTLNGGVVQVGVTKILTLRITNNGTEALTGPAVLDNTNFSLINGYNCSGTLNKGSSCNIKVSFNSTGKTSGVYESVLTMDGVTANLTITVDAPVVEEPDMEQVGLFVSGVELEEVDFGVVQAGKTSAIKTLTIKNLSSGPITGAVVSLPSGFNLNYDMCSNKNIAKGGTCTIKASFTALSSAVSEVKISEFEYMGLVTDFKVEVNNPSIPSSSSSGGAVDSGLVFLSNSLSVETLDFGNITPSGSKMLIIYIKNTGAVKTTAFTPSLADNNFTIVYNQCVNKILSPNATCQMRISVAGAGKSGEVITAMTALDKTLNLKVNVNSVIPDVITYKPNYSDFGSCSVTTACLGAGVESRVLNTCEKVVNGVASGEIVSNSLCTNLSLTQSCLSPEGDVTSSITGGSQVMHCLSGQTTGEIVSVSCTESGYSASIDNKSCVLDLVSYDPVLSDFSTCSATEPCAGVGEQTRSVQACERIVNGIPSGILDDASLCSSSVDTALLTQSCNSPAGEAEQVIAGGSKVVSCLVGETTGEVISLNCSESGYEPTLDNQSCEYVVVTYNPIFSDFSTCSASQVCMGEGIQTRVVEGCERVQNGIPTGVIEVSSNCESSVEGTLLTQSCLSPAGEIEEIVTGGIKTFSCTEGSSVQTLVSLNCNQSGYEESSDGVSCQMVSSACASNEIFLNGQCQVFTGSNVISSSSVADVITNVNQNYYSIYNSDYYDSYIYDSASSAFSNLFTQLMVGETWDNEMGMPVGVYQTGCFANLSGIDDWSGTGVRASICQSFGGTPTSEYYNGDQSICQLPATESQCQQAMNDLTTKLYNALVVSDCYSDYGGMQYCSGWKVNAAYPWLANSVSSVSTQVATGLMNQHSFVKVNGEGFYVFSHYQYLMFKPFNYKMVVMKASTGEKVEFDFTDVKDIANLIVDPKNASVVNGQIYIPGFVRRNVANGVEARFVIHKVNPTNLTVTKVVEQVNIDNFSNNYYNNRTNHFFMKDNEFQWTNFTWAYNTSLSDSTVLTRYKLPVSGTTAVNAGTITLLESTNLNNGSTANLASGEGFVRAEVALNKGKISEYYKVKLVSPNITVNYQDTNSATNEVTALNNQTVDLNNFFGGHSTNYTFHKFQVLLGNEYVNVPSLWTTASVPNIERLIDPEFGYSVVTFDFEVDAIKSVIKVGENKALVVGTRMRLVSTEGSNYGYGIGRLTNVQLNDWEMKLYNFSTNQVEATFTLTNRGMLNLTEYDLDNGNFYMNMNDETVLNLSSAQANSRYILLNGSNMNSGYNIYKVIDTQLNTLKDVTALSNYYDFPSQFLGEIKLIDDSIYFISTTSYCSGGYVEYGGCGAVLHKVSALNADTDTQGETLDIVELNQTDGGYVNFRVNFFKDKVFIKLDGYNGYGGYMNSVTQYNLPQMTSEYNNAQVEECVFNFSSLFGSASLLGPKDFSASNLTGFFCPATGPNGTTLYRLDW